MELFYAVAIERSFKKQLVVDNHMKRMGGQSKLPFPKCNGPE